MVHCDADIHEDGRLIQPVPDSRNIVGMTTPVEKVTVECSDCGHRYEDYHRRSMSAGHLGSAEPNVETRMRTENLIAAMNMRARDIQMSVLPYVAIHAVVLLSIVFGGSGLQADGVQLALAAFAVLGSIWITLGIDGAVADIGAAAKDMDEEMAASHMGQNWVKAPFGLSGSLDLSLPRCFLSLS